MQKGMLQHIGIGEPHLMCPWCISCLKQVCTRWMQTPLKGQSHTVPWWIQSQFTTWGLTQALLWHQQRVRDKCSTPCSIPVMSGLGYGALYPPQMAPPSPVWWWLLDHLWGGRGEGKSLNPVPLNGLCLLSPLFPWEMGERRARSNPVEWPMHLFCLSSEAHASCFWLERQEKCGNPS